MKWRKRLFIFEIALVVLLPIVALGWISIATRNESPAIEQAVRLMLYERKYGDAEQEYKQWVPVAQRGRISLSDLRFVKAGPDGELELYQSIEVEVLGVIPWWDVFPLRDDEAVARVVLTYEHGCQVPFVFVLHQIDDGKWKVYDLNYDYRETDPLKARDCIEGKMSRLYYNCL